MSKVAKTVRQYPDIPGAVTKAPDWIGPGAPFDVVKYFEAPPRNQNAAPLYLDAFFEFSDEVAECFPEGSERERRRQIAADRLKRLKAFLNGRQTNPQSVSTADLDKLLIEYEDGFRKLAKAQARDRCVFETGIRVAAPVPHVLGAQWVVIALYLHAQRYVNRGDFEKGLQDVATLLRLARDLKPRGDDNALGLAAETVDVVCRRAVTEILAARGLRIAHCDRLLRLLAEHEANTVDSFTMSVQIGYIFSRWFLRDLTSRPAELVRELHAPDGTSVGKALAGLPSTYAIASTCGDIDALLAKEMPHQVARDVQTLNAYFRSLLALKGASYTRRIERLPDLQRMISGNEGLCRIIAPLQPALPNMFEGLALSEASLGLAQCLVALKRWQMTHKAQPSDLGTVVQNARMKAVPTDPYDGKPLRMANVGGELVVYSVYTDGKDDGGLKSAKQRGAPGDMVFRIPNVAVKR